MRFMLVIISVAALLGLSGCCKGKDKIDVPKEEPTPEAADDDSADDDDSAGDDDSADEGKAT